MAALAQRCDLLVLTETRETLERKTTFVKQYYRSHWYVSSFIDQFKGGIGILIKHSFCERFGVSCHEDLLNCWDVLIEGRLGRLRLQGNEGSLDVFAVYMDPASKLEQCNSVARLAGSIDRRVHSLITGDFNFVEGEFDRWRKDGSGWSLGADVNVAKMWREKIASQGLHEWDQPMHTCETGLVCSRIDRCYSSLHLAHVVTDDIFCYALDRFPEISSHRLVEFGLRRRAQRNSNCNYIPEWVVKHPLFKVEFKGEMGFRGLLDLSTSASGFERLRELKQAALSASRYVRRRCKLDQVATTEGKLSVSVCFLRALHIGDYSLAASLQSKYHRLRDVTADSGFQEGSAYQLLKDHVVSLSHSNIQDRIQELKAARCNLPDSVYKQRKDNILQSLTRLLPGRSGRIDAVRDEETSEVVNDCHGIGRVLTRYWQKVFDGKSTDELLRSTWLSRVRSRGDVDINSLLPSFQDVELVLSQLPSSSPGPDGVPFALYKQFKHIVAPIFYDIVTRMIAGSESPPADFNYAFLICLPKSAAVIDGNGQASHDPGNTRPLSIVDAANRIIASIFKVCLERVAGDWVIDCQRGFLKGRQMLQNIIDMDFAAQKVSIKYKRGCILLLDFRAAFPSISHEFMWDCLAALGLPRLFLLAIQKFYVNNAHWLCAGGELMKSVVVRSGVRQGCPLSPLIFALCSDVLLRELSQLLGLDEVACAFADDTGLVVSDYTKSLPSLCLLFSEFERISGLSLNIAKTVFIPLWETSSFANVRRLILEVCPPWRDICIDNCGKYLGFFIGPGAGQRSWAKSIQKYEQRAQLWASLHLGLFWTITAYKVFVASVLSFVMQLESTLDDLQSRFTTVVRKLFPGPGMWVTPNDLCNLSSWFKFPAQLANPTCVALAAKLRVIAFVCPNCTARAGELANLHLEWGRRPFPTWHNRAYVKVLSDAEKLLATKAITVKSVHTFISQVKAVSFQATAHDLIKTNLFSGPSRDSRLRTKLSRFRVSTLLGHLDRVVASRFHLLSSWCPPRILAAVFRTHWNGWVTTARMKGVFRQSGQTLKHCLLGCGCGEDSLHHYLLCEVFWSFIRRRRGAGLGVTSGARTWDSALLLSSSLSDEDVVRLAAGIYGLYQTVNVLRFHKINEEARVPTLLSVWTTRGMEGSAAARLLDVFIGPTIL